MARLYCVYGGTEEFKGEMAGLCQHCKAVNEDAGYIVTPWEDDPYEDPADPVICGDCWGMHEAEEEEEEE